MGSRGNILNNLNYFLNKFKKFIKCKDLYQIYKFKEESWSEYLHRIKSNYSTTDKDDEEIIRKLRGDLSPKVIQCILYSTDSLSIIIQRLEGFDNNRRSKEKKIFS
ncbi:hypothetical protein DMUE_4749 [Dictyocoela muelleri]|nr:hypothetical protein DMUE_4749 [Dictyocoela muelleri]